MVCQVPFYLPQISSKYFQFALCHHLGFGIYKNIPGSAAQPICPVCEDSNLDPAGLLAQACGREAGFTFRHY